jgi:hypothetical protein
MAMFASKISVTCSECKNSITIPRPYSVNLIGSQWEVMPCPTCGYNLAPEARLVLAETGQKEGICILLLGVALVGVVLALA